MPRVRFMLEIEAELTDPAMAKKATGGGYTIEPAAVAILAADIMDCVNHGETPDFIASITRAAAFAMIVEIRPAPEDDSDAT